MCSASVRPGAQRVTIARFRTVLLRRLATIATMSTGRHLRGMAPQLSARQSNA